MSEYLSRAAQDVIAERKRQAEVEGWTAEHDDEHDNGEMAVAAGCIAALPRRTVEQCRDIDLSVASVLDMLSDATDGTDASGPLADLAASLRATVEQDRQREAEANDEHEYWMRRSSRYRTAVAEGVV